MKKSTKQAITVLATFTAGQATKAFITYAAWDIGSIAYEAVKAGKPQNYIKAKLSQFHLKSIVIKNAIFKKVA